MMRYKRELRRTIFWALLLAALPCDSLRADETPAQRRQRLEAMTPAEKEELRQKQHRFYALDLPQQQQLKQLHQAIAENAEAQRLQQVSVRYSQWLGTLSPRRRAELLALPADERIERIKEIKQQQEAQHFHELVAKDLSADDRRAIFQWLGEFVRRHETEILASCSQERRERFNRYDDPQRRLRWLIYSLNRHGGEQDMPRPSREEVDQLVGRLSQEAHDVLEEARGPDEKEMLVQRWIRAALFARMAPQVSEERLQQFFEEMELDDQERERLEHLSREELMLELRKRFYQIMFSRRDRSFGPPYGRRGPGGGAGRGPGDGRRGPGGGPPRFSPPRNGNGPQGGGPRGDGQRGGGPRGGGPRDGNGRPGEGRPPRPARPQDRPPPDTTASADR